MCASILLSGRNTPPTFGLLSPSNLISPNPPVQTVCANYNKNLDRVKTQKMSPSSLHKEQDDSRLSLRNTQAPINASRPADVATLASRRVTIAAATPSPTAIELRPDITIISIVSNQGPVSSMLFFEDLFALIARYALPIVLTATSIVSITVALPASKNLSAAIKELESLYLGCVKVESGNAILSVVGEKLWYVYCVLVYEYTASRTEPLSSCYAHPRDDAGLIGKCCNATSAEDIDIKMISQGAAKGSISIVIAEGDGEKAMVALRRALLDK